MLAGPRKHLLTAFDQLFRIGLTVFGSLAKGLHHFAFEALHAEAFAESFDFGGITSPASSDGQAYLEFVLRESWERVKGREDGDQAKILIYMFVTTRAITIDSRPLERNADMERAIREARGDAPR